MSLANYTDLKTATAEWLYRTGDTALVTRVPDFISLFESDFVIDPSMRNAEMQELDTTPIASAYVALPTGFIDMVRLQVLGGTYTQNQVLEYVTPSRAAVLDALTPSTGASGTARFYTVIAGQIVITPQRWAPVGSTLEMVYYSFTPLSVAAPTNWLMTKYPNLYLYGSLMQAAAYVDDNDTVIKWKSARDEAIAKLSKTELKRRLGAGPLVIRPSAAFRR